jgi:2-dehydropantoate 2-reductase
MRILMVGAGVIGTVYGAHAADSGAQVSVLAHGSRTDAIALRGLTARDVVTGRLTEAAVTVIAEPETNEVDLVVVAVRREQLDAACARLAGLPADQTILLLGNNTAGHSVGTVRQHGSWRLGFPGIGGTMNDGTAEYVRIKQQPTALEAGDDARLDWCATALHAQGFAVQRITDMDGWLKYHAVFIACIGAALGRCGTDPRRLADDRPTVRLMCRAITEGFAALQRQQVGGMPRNLALLHNRLLMPIARGYWARTMRSPMGELCFAAHTRHANVEMRLLRGDVLSWVQPGKKTLALHELLKTD